MQKIHQFVKKNFRVVFFKTGGNILCYLHSNRLYLFCFEFSDMVAEENCDVLCCGVGVCSRWP